MKEKRPLNPAEAFRRSQKRKAKKEKLDNRKQKVAQIPLDKRDPYQLISEIQKYNILDYEGKLTGDGRTHKKKLTDRFYALRKARINAGLEAIELPKFDPEAYEQQKQKAKMGGGYNVILERMLEDVRSRKAAEEAYDPETGLPRPPSEPCPYTEGVPGLPPYKRLEQPCEEPSIAESHPIMFSAEAKHTKKFQKDKVDREVDDFLREINTL